MTLDQILLSMIDKEIDAYERGIAALPEPMFSAKHDRQIKKAINIANSSRHTVRRAGMRRAAIAMVAAILLLASVIATVAAVYPEFFMVIEKRRVDWLITFEQKGDDAIDFEFEPQIGDTPEGYEITEYEEMDDLLTVVYTSLEDDSKQILYLQDKIYESTVVGLDAENDYMEIVELDGVDTIVMREDDNYMLFWIEKGCEYTLLANCDIEILKDYKKSIKSVK